MPLKGSHSRQKCDRCGLVVSVSNMRRHRNGSKCAPKCDACGKRFDHERDDETGRPLLGLGLLPTCEDTCDTCPQCGRRVGHDDPEAVQIASTDEEAGTADPTDAGACGRCWDYRRRHGRWPDSA